MNTTCIDKQVRREQRIEEKLQLILHYAQHFNTLADAQTSARKEDTLHVVTQLQYDYDVRSIEYVVTNLSDALWLERHGGQIMRPDFMLPSLTPPQDERRWRIWLYDTLSMWNADELVRGVKFLKFIIDMKLPDCPADIAAHLEDVQLMLNVTQEILDEYKK